MIFFVMTVVLGGIPAFSAFSLDTFKLLEVRRMVLAGGYGLASVVLSLAAFFSGILLKRGVWG
jgi:CrcB protein